MLKKVFLKDLILVAWKCIKTRFEPLHTLKNNFLRTFEVTKNNFLMT